MTKPQGQIVKVNGQNMHIRTMGCGYRTIVLLPGWNIPLPSVEFAPLMRALSEKYTMCTVELFGYGHSDGTDTPRTNENIAEEIRKALLLVGLKPPYVLMPYSCSGMYSEYYAIKYPQEVEALILLDCMSTGEEMSELTEEDLEELQQIADEYYEIIVELEGASFKDFESDISSGVMGPEELEELEFYLQCGYTKEEIFETSTLPNHMETLVAQYKALPANVHELFSTNTKLAETIPVLMMNAEIGYGCEGDEIEESRVELAKAREIHRDKLGSKAKIVVIDGSHHGDIYYHIDEIVQEIDGFLESI